MLGDFDSFKREFESIAMTTPGVTSVVFAGSMGRGTFVPGKSDADILVFGDVSIHDRLHLYDILWELNLKYELGLEYAPMIHPPIVFVDQWWEKALLNWVAQGGREDLRASLKRVAPRTGRLIELYNRIRSKV